MSRITFDVDDREVQAALGRVIAAGKDPRPLLKGIGETLTASSKRRFVTSTAPDGSRWAPNTQATYLGFLNARKGSFGKKGKISAKGAARAIAKKPLIGETRSLSTTINWQMLGRDAVAVGSPMIYASTQQFGAKKGQFGRTKRGAPIPWGEIPPRPFLGVSAQDRADILELAADYLLIE